MMSIYAAGYWPLHFSSIMTNLFVPGRLCLFGEHTDWAGHYRTMNAEVFPGAAIVTGIEQGIYAEVEPSQLFCLTSEAPELQGEWSDFSCRMVEAELKSVARSGSFFCYCAGVASYMLEWYKVGGVHIHIRRMTLPIKSGLSSSAAICVLVARAFNELYHLGLNTLGEMNIAYLGELRTQSRCGRLDQACAFGVKPNLMEFDGDEIEVRPLNVATTLHYVFADLMASKDTIAILSDLNKSYPFPSTDADRRLHEAFGQRNRSIVDRAIACMAKGDARGLGKLMDESEALFDECVAPMSPALWAPKLKSVLADGKVRSLAYGGKGVGSHGDGSVQLLAKGKQEQTELVDYLNASGLRAYPFDIRPVHAVRRAIIPVAGFGTRLYPATCAVSKDFFPIPCPDGIVRPVVLILLEELIASGVEDICIVLGGDSDRLRYADFFECQLSPEHYAKLSEEMKEYSNHILDIGKRLHYVYQREKRGFGHAVWQAADFAAGEPVLLLLGDTLYRSNTAKPCALQLIEQYERTGGLTLALHTIPVADVCRYGILTGVWEDKQAKVLNVNRMTEKPTSAYAEEYLATKSARAEGDSSAGEKEYCSVFGQYILTPEVFRQLADDIAAADDPTKEIELTAALEAVRARSGMKAFRIDGQMYDMGNPKAFAKAVEAFGS